MLGPLEGLKVLDFTTLLPGPYAALCLGDMGAEVLKISAPNRVDLVAELEPKIDGKGANLLWLQRNKRSLELNLKTPEGVAVVKELVKEYDILLEQFRPGVMEKLGLGYETLSAINPRLIYCSITGYGQEGPYRDRAGHDINYLSLSGIMNHSGRKKGGPVLYGTQIADIGVGSMNAVTGVLAGVISREKTGLGQHVDVAMMDGLMPFNSLAAASALAGGREPEREGEMLNGGSAYDFYETKDGRYLGVGSLEPKFWANLCKAIGREEWVEKTVFFQGMPEGKESLRKVFQEKTRDEWVDIFRDADACVEPVLSLEEAVNTENARARGLTVEVEGVRQFAYPVKFSRTPATYRHGGKALGADTDDVLGELGYSPEEIQELKEKGVTK